MSYKKIVLYIISPTYLYADYKKKKLDEEKKARFIIRKNKKYFLFSLILFLVFILIDNVNFYQNNLFPSLFLLCYFFFSRVNEIFISFLLDALDKLNHSYKVSYMTFKERIELALFSYLEIIINYAMIFWVIHISFGLFNENYLQLMNMLYYSGTTIVLLGYGDIYATHFIPQLLSVYEVFNGMILVIVCFTIYVHLSFNKALTNRIEDYRTKYNPDVETINVEYQKFKKKNKYNLIIALISLFIFYILCFLIITLYFPINIVVSGMIYLINTFIVLITFNRQIL